MSRLKVAFLRWRLGVWASGRLGGWVLSTANREKLCLEQPNNETRPCASCVMRKRKTAFCVRLLQGSGAAALRSPQQFVRCAALLRSPQQIEARRKHRDFESSFPPCKGGSRAAECVPTRCGLRRHFGEVGGQFFRRGLRRQAGGARLHVGADAACCAALPTQGAVPLGRQGRIENRPLLFCVCRLLCGGASADCRAALLAQGAVPLGQQGRIENRPLLFCVCRLLGGGASAACRAALLAQGAVPLGRQGRIGNCAIF